MGEAARAVPTVVRKRDPLNVELGNITKYDASCSSESATGWHYSPTEKKGWEIEQ